jgi:hypothetical protein
MKVVTFDGQRGEFPVRDFDPRGVVSVIELRLDAQASIIIPPKTDCDTWLEA